MQPLTPKDLLIRQADGAPSEWSGNDPPRDETPAVPLERFQALEHVIRDTPIHVEPYLELGDIYIKAERWTDARRVLEQAVARFPDDEQANYWLEEATLCRSLELFHAARKEHELEPTQLTQENLDRCRVELNVLREKVCQARLRRHPDQLELCLTLATAQENLGKSSSAIETLRRAFEHPPLRARAGWQLGQVLERAQRVPEALSAYRRAALFRVPPASREIKEKALLAAADLAERSGMIDSARRYMQLLVELQPDHTEWSRRLAELRQTAL